MNTITEERYKNSGTAPPVAKVADALADRRFIPLAVDTGAEALAKIQGLIPAGASVMNGASETLREIGYIELLKSGKHPWKNLHDAILAEPDPGKQAQLRKASVLSDFYVGSAHALTETGEIMVSSNSGSQLPHLAFTSPNIVLVVSADKIVPALQDAFARLENYVVPLEDERMKGVYGFGTMQAKTLILHRENPAMGRKVYVIIVNESLGF